MIYAGQLTTQAGGESELNSIAEGSTVSDGNNLYTLDRRLGSGGFADVYHAVNDGKEYAIKISRDNNDKNLFSIKNEFEIASKVNSVNAIKYFFLNEYGQNGYPCFIIMEYAKNGSLEDEYQNRTLADKPYSTEELLNIYMQLIDGMIDISRVAVHRDIKPQNILISDGIYKISDYGLAKHVNEATRAKTMKGAGSLFYYAPELWANPTAHGINDVKIDIYAMGIVFYQLANLSYPYEIISDHRAMHMFSPIKGFDRRVDPVFQSLIRKMMEKSKTKRFSTWEEIKQFLQNTSIGNGIERDVFIDGMIKSSVEKKRIVDEETAKIGKQKSEQEESFKRLAGQIESEIYIPLKELVNEFNNDSPERKAHITNMNVYSANETFSFTFTLDGLSLQDRNRTIQFSFNALHTEIRTDNQIASFSDYNRWSTDPFNRPYTEPRKTEFMFRKERLLLWGTAIADCGLAVNLGIVEDPEDALYGVLKSFIRTPNVSGSINGAQIWLPIDMVRLRKLCRNDFYELTYTIKAEEFDFEIIKKLIQQNETSDYDSVKDPFSNGLC